MTPAEKATADKWFDSLDTAKRGYIEGDIAVPFMLESGLSGDELAAIWWAAFVIIRLQASNSDSGICPTCLLTVTSPEMDLQSPGT